MLRIFVLLSLFFAALFADLKVVNENELTQMQNKNVVVIDIRTLGEWKEYGIIDEVVKRAADKAVEISGK